MLELSSSVYRILKLYVGVKVHLVYQLVVSFKPGAWY